MGTPALYIPSRVVVDVIQDGEEMAFVKFPGGKAIWVKSNELDFDDLGGDDDWGPENVDDFRADVPDDDVALMDDWYDDPVDYFDFEYDRP